MPIRATDGKRSRRQRARLLDLAALAALAAVAATASPAHAALAPDAKRTCAYSAHSIPKLVEFGEIVGRPIDCALVFTAPDSWENWENPWFLTHGDPDFNWRNWATAAGTDRELIITQALIPQAAESANWRELGAAGAYDEHARALAAKLLKAGLGDAVIRLNHEMNGDWFANSIGNTDAEYALWVAFWRRTVTAMRSVPGAQFQFDWCINGRYRPIALSKFYPGDDYVDLIGIDAYDSGVPAGQPRWKTIYEKPNGIRDLRDFAVAHGKPMSIPEWGVAPANVDSSGGDDAEYVDGIASVVASNTVAYQSYFYNHSWAWQLANGPLSLAAYTRHFGSGATPPPPPPTPPPAPPATQPTALAPIAPATKAPAADKTPPSLRIRSGPKRGKRPGSVTFTFRAESGAKTACRVDAKAWRLCSKRDTLRRLRRGRHTWLVAARDDAGNVNVRKRRFSCRRSAAGVRCGR